MAGSEPVLPKNWPRQVRSAVLHAISLARVCFIGACSWAAEHRSKRVRFRAENECLRQEVALLAEEIRIKDARMERVPAHHRPHYQPRERLAILELRAARGWSLNQTADRFHVATATVSSWTRRLNEAGPAAIVQVQAPVNKFPEFVAYIVQKLGVLCPTFGQAKIAQVLCRAGLHLGATTVRRMLRQTILPDDPEKTVVISKTVLARYPNHVWSCDLTTVPTSFGFWTSYFPFAVPQRWPFCWWVATIVDHFSRRIMGSALYRQQPTSRAVRMFLTRVMREARCRPRYLVTDHGKQFRDERFRKWLRGLGIRQRFGAVGKYGSIAVIERLIQTIKRECTRRVIVTFVARAVLHELALFSDWYNHERPHEGLLAATPDETYRGLNPACLKPRFEPRAMWPADSPCAAPHSRVRGRPGVRLDLHVSYLAGRKHLPIVSLKRAA